MKPLTRMNDFGQNNLNKILNQHTPRARLGLKHVAPPSSNSLNKKTEIPPPLTRVFNMSSYVIFCCLMPCVLHSLFENWSYLES